MVAYAPYVAGTAALSSVYNVPTGFPAGNATSTVKNDEYCALATVTVYEYMDEPTAYPTSNTHGHGGPYYNPYNDIPQPVIWPGLPSAGQTEAPPRPSPPFKYGGPAKDDYEAPAWIPKGHGKLDGSLPDGKQNGDSKWGDIDCPHLPITGLPDGPSYPTLTGGYEVPYPTGSGYPSYYPSSSGSGVYPSGHPSGYPSGSGSVSYPYPSGSGHSSIYSSGTITVSYSSSASASASNSANSTTTSTPVPACPTMPDTGVTRTYEMNIAYQTIAPDGVTRNGLLVNGQFPGPLVEANWGDWILFKVTNDLTDEGTAIHAHGLLQSETPWYDGVPAVDQCPITPNGGTFDMLFRADRYGTSWWHSHYSAQYSGGAHGPLVVYGPKHAEYDIDIGPIVLEDWFHADYYSLVEGVMGGVVPLSNNNLINGKMQYPCANTTLPCDPNAGISKFKFESGKKHLLRLINAGAEGTEKFSIDGHKLTVVALDFVPIEPYETNVVTLAIGQRCDVIVEATGEPGDAYWMRAQLGTARCTLNDGISPNAVAAVYYEDADTESVPTTESDVTADQLAACRNDPLTNGIPLCKIPVEEPDVTQTIELTFRSNGTNFLWWVDNSSYRGDYNQPTLLQAKFGDNEFNDEWNIYEFGGNGSVRIHLVNRGLAGSHPMHLHGHDFHVLAEGFGEWDGTVTNPENTVRRDVQLLQNARNTADGIVPSFMVIQFNQDNPGVWPFHCHLAWHVSAGLFMQFLERKEDIMQQDFDADVLALCPLWDAYTAGNPPNQIDSGL